MEIVNCKVEEPTLSLPLLPTLLFLHSYAYFYVYYYYVYYYYYYIIAISTTRLLRSYFTNTTTTATITIIVITLYSTKNICHFEKHCQLVKYGNYIKIFCSALCCRLSIPLTRLSDDIIRPRRAGPVRLLGLFR